MSLFKKIITSASTASAVKNAGWLIAEKVLSMLLVLGISILVARHLGPESFGQLSYLLALIALLSPLTSLGLNAIITRELVKTPKNSTQIMSSALALRLSGGIVAALILYLVTLLGGFSQLAELGWALILLSLTNIVTAFHVIDYWFQARVESRYIVKVRFASLLLSCAVKAVLVMVNAELAAFIWAAAFEFTVIALSFCLIYLYRGGKFQWRQINIGYGLDLLKQSKWLILSGIASVVYLKIDQVMLGEMVSTSEVGIYAVASRMSEVWYFFPTAIVASFFPSLLRLKEQSSGLYQRQLQRLCDGLFVGAVLIAVPITFLSDWLIVFLFGPAYESAGMILSLHIWAGIFVFMRALLSKWLLAEHLLFFSFATHGIGAVINVALNWWLIPKMQGQGAAIATVISYAFASYFALFFHSSTRPMAMIMTKSLFIASRLPGLRVKSTS